MGPDGDSKKDLTRPGEADFVLTPESGPSADGGGTIEAPPPEAIDEFESLDALSRRSPAPNPGTLADPADAGAPPADIDGGPAPEDPFAAPIALGPPPGDGPAIELGGPPADDLVPPLPPPPQGGEALSRMRETADRMPVGASTATAVYPFSVLIEGPLRADERERLLDLLEREKFGITEADLVPQFAGDRVLLPRISEYAAILVVQALRATRARIRMGPADTIFATDDTRSDGTEPISTAEDRAVMTGSSLEADAIPVTAEASLPGVQAHELVDLVLATATLKSRVVEVDASGEYQELLERLKRELKHKASRKGATAIVGFRVTLTPLTSPTHFRVTALGSAVRVLR